MRNKKAIIDFIINAYRDFREVDKMFIHVGRLQADTHYRAYIINSQACDATPLSFEDWLMKEVFGDE